MREIEQLYYGNGATITPFASTEISPEKVITESASLDGKMKAYYAVVKDIDTKEKVMVNLSLLIAITTLVNDARTKLAVNCNPEWKPGDKLPEYAELTWEVIGECLTEKLIAGFKCAVPEFDNIEKCVRFSQVITDPDFECHYCLLDTPEDRDSKFRRWKLLDMAITKLNPDSPIQLENCLLSVNGCLSRPIMFNGELLMSRGAQFIHNNTCRDGELPKHPSVTLIDFTNLGGITCIPFSECQYRIRTGRESGQIPVGGTIVPGKDIQVELPEQYSLVGKNVWMVLGHSLYFGESIIVNGERTVVISPHMLSLDMALMKAGYHAYTYFENTDVFHSDWSITEYINVTAWEKSHYGAFFVVINAPVMYMKRTPTNRHGDSTMYITKSGVDGLLWDRTNHSFTDHTRQGYASITDYYAFCHNRNKYFTTHGFFELSQTGTDDLHPWYSNFIPVNDSEMEVVEITRG